MGPTTEVSNMNSIQASCLWLALILLPIAIGCRGEPDAPGGVNSQASIKPTVFASGMQSGIGEAGLFICRDRKTFTHLWARHMAMQNPKSPVPVVTFSSESVAAVFLGDRPTSGYSLSVLELKRTSKGWVLRTSEKAPKVDDPQLQVETRPFVFVLVPNHVDEIVWDHKS
jgi:hypothetical protein